MSIPPSDEYYIKTNFSNDQTYQDYLNKLLQFTLSNQQIGQQMANASLSVEEMQNTLQNAASEASNLLQDPSYARLPQSLQQHLKNFHDATQKLLQNTESLGQTPEEAAHSLNSLQSSIHSLGSAQGSTQNGWAPSQLKSFVYVYEMFTSLCAEVMNGEISFNSAQLRMEIDLQDLKNSFATYNTNYGQSGLPTGSSFLSVWNSVWEFFNAMVGCKSLATFKIDYASLIAQPNLFTRLTQYMQDFYGGPLPSHLPSGWGSTSNVVPSSHSSVPNSALTPITSHVANYQNYFSTSAPSPLFSTASTPLLNSLVNSVQDAQDAIKSHKHHALADIINSLNDTLAQLYLTTQSLEEPAKTAAQQLVLNWQNQVGAFASQASSIDNFTQSCTALMQEIHKYVSS